MRTCLLFLLVVVLGLSQTKPRWKDRAEYDLAQRAQGAPTADEKVKLLLEWTRLYPDSEIRLERQAMLVTAYDSAGKAEETFAAARQLLQNDSRNLLALHAVCKWAPRLKTASADDAAAVSKAAKELLSRLDEVLPEQRTRRDLNSLLDSVESGKPARMEQRPYERRKKQRAEVEQTAQQAIVWADRRP